MKQKYIQGHVNTCLLNLSRLIVTGKEMAYTMEKVVEYVLSLFSVAKVKVKSKK